MSHAREQILATWGAIRSRFTAYELVIPGEPGFVCQAELCSANCCKAFSVSLGDAEAERMWAASGLPANVFLECEEGEPIRLPLRSPFLLARRDGHCAMLGEDLACTQYEGRPDACRQYPHHVIFVDVTTSKPVHADLPRMAVGLGATLAGERANVVPLLLRHLECPGFTGPPLREVEWRQLLRRIARLQYAELQGEPVELVV